jgi:hypothetical protein
MIQMMKSGSHGAVDEQQLTTEHLGDVTMLNDSFESGGELVGGLAEAREGVERGVTIERHVGRGERNLEQQRLLFGAAMLAEQREEMLARVDRQRRVVIAQLELVEQRLLVGVGRQQAAQAGQRRIAFGRIEAMQQHAPRAMRIALPIRRFARQLLDWRSAVGRRSNTLVAIGIYIERAREKKRERN